jgi:hypothetical protein
VSGERSGYLRIENAALSFARRTSSLPISFAGRHQHPVEIDCAALHPNDPRRSIEHPVSVWNLDAERAVSWRSKHMCRKRRFFVSRICPSLRDLPSARGRRNPPNAPLPEKIFGIICRVVRLRNSVRAAAVKSPEQMRDVAQFECEQVVAINVDDPEGTWTFSETEISAAFEDA